jgi:hypothetical protein
MKSNASFVPERINVASSVPKPGSKFVGLENRSTHNCQLKNGGLKGHGNEADFLGFLQKLVPHRSLTVPFEPFRFWLRRVGESFFDYEYLREFDVKIGTARNVV